MSPDGTVHLDASSTIGSSSAMPLLPGGWRLLLLVVLVLLAAVGWWTFSTVERQFRGELAAGLTAVHEADVTALNTWIDGQFVAAGHVAGQADVGAAAVELVRASAAGADTLLLLMAPAAVGLSERLRPQCDMLGYCGYQLVGPDGTILAADVDDLVGRPLGEPALLDRMLEGRPVLGLPRLSPVPLPDATGRVRPGVPTMFVGAPVRDADGAVVAALGLRVHPETDFTRILSVAGSGQTGQTYAFDGQGELLTEPRFSDQLKALGLVPDRPDATAVRSVRLRDPGANLVRQGPGAARKGTRPLTRMALSATKGQSGVDVDGYRDLRGVPVVGAWTWLPAHRFGIATEVEASEAFGSLLTLRTVFFVLFGLLVLAALGVIFSSRLVAMTRRRMSGALARAERLGQYTLEDVIGQGAIGTVYRARHALLRRPTALKLLRPDQASPADVARFEREVQATSQLTNPHTIAIYDYGRTADGLFYYVMEYLDGLTLKQLVRQDGIQPEGRVIHVLRQICSSLAEAHALGLIHRDIKPANVMLCRQGGLHDVVKVVDFGLVKSLVGEGGGEATAAHVLTGTPHFVSPEAVQSSQAIDARSDLYAVGLVGYWLLTGGELFPEATGLAELLHCHQVEPPEPPSRRRGRPVPADLESVIMRCLAKRPGDRPQSAAELSSRLGACLDASSWSEEAAREWWQRQRPRADGRRAADAAPSGSETLVVGLHRD